jgi:hypothetical protein
MKVVKIYNGSHHCVPLVETIEKHIWNVQFGDRMKELCPLESCTCELQELPMDQTGTSGPRPELPIRGRKLRTGTSGPRPELPIDDTGSSDPRREIRTDLFQIVFWQVLGVGNL